MTCLICGSESKKIFDAKILNKYTISYFECPSCRFIQTEKPYWLDEAYASPMNLPDTGILVRNEKMKKVVALLLSRFFDKNGKYLDFSGGYGVFTRMMRDIGFDYYWMDPYTKNLLARGFEYTKELGRMELITAFEVLEHFDTPITSLAEIFSLGNSLLCTTDIAPTPTPQPTEWWYYGLEHGQHISFYRKETFEYIAQKFNKNLAISRNMFLFTDKNISSISLKILVNMANILYPILKNTVKPKHYSDMELLREKL